MEISKAGWGLGSGEQVLGSWSVLDILQVLELVHWPGSRGLGSIITDGHFDCIHAFFDVAVMVVTLHLFRFPFLASFLYEGNVDKKTGEVTFDPQYKATKRTLYIESGVVLLLREMDMESENIIEWTENGQGGIRFTSLPCLLARIRLQNLGGPFWEVPART